MSIIKAVGFEAALKALRGGYSHIYISFSKNAESKKWVDLFAQELAYNRRCRILEIRKHTGHVINYGEILEKNTTLRSLALTGNHLRSDDAKEIANGLANNTTLISLNLWNNYVGDDGAREIANALLSNKTLKNLRLGSNSIGNSGAEAFGNALLVNTSLKYIGLGSNKINDVTVLAQALHTNPALENLCLGDNDVEDTGAIAIGKALCENNESSLKDLDLNWNRIGHEGAEAISSGLAENKTLEILNLRGNIIGPLGGIHIGKALCFNNVLTDLSLSGNGIGYEGAVELGKSLARNRTLTTLHLQDNEIGDIIGATSIGNSLAENTRLSTLNLRNNRIGNEGAKAIGGSLNQNASLTNIDLSFNSIGNGGAIAIGKGLEENCSLVSVNMASNTIDPFGAEMLVQSLKKNYILKELETGHNVPAVKEFLIRNRGQTEKIKRSTHLKVANIETMYKPNSTDGTYPFVESIKACDPEEEETKRQTRLAIKRALKNGDTTHYRRSKLMLIGKQRHGKSSLVRSLVGDNFNSNEKSTNVAQISDACTRGSLEQTGVQTWKPKKEGDHIFIGEFQEAAIRMAQDMINCMNSLNSNTERETNLDFFNNNLVTEKREIESLKKSNMMKENSLGRKKKLSPGSLSLNSSAGRGESCTSFKINDADFGKKFGENMAITEVASENDTLSFSIWDFAGQEVFYAMHHVFLTRYGVYLLVFDMREVLNNTEQAISDLKFWINSVELHAPDAPVVLVGTFADHIIEDSQLLFIDTLFTENLEIDHNTQICFNHDSELSFFPVDNTGGSGEGNIQAVRKKIERIIRGVDIEKFDMDYITNPVKLAWMCFLDSLLERGVPCMNLSEVETAAQACGISKTETSEILDFFHELGCIVYFSETEKLSQVVILDPQWLVKALGCVIYDQDFNPNYSRKLPRELRRHHKRFKDLGILSESLLQYKLQNYKPHIEFLKDLMENMLLMAPWIFDEHERSEPQYLIPSLVRASDEDFAIEYKGPYCYLDFPKRYPPHVVFRRLVCLCIEESAKYEGSREPKLHGSVAHFSFGFNIEFKMDIVASDSSNRIKISTRPSRQLAEFVQFLDNSIVDIDIKGDEMKWSILLPYENKSLYIRSYESNPIPPISNTQILVDYKTVQSAWSKGETAIKRQNSTGSFSSSDIKISELKPWLEIYETEPIADSSLASDKISDGADKIWDCFLAHDWGPSGLGHPTHRTVQHICSMLTRNEFKPWFDENNMGANLAESMVTGIDGSHCVVIFISERYCQRLNDMNTNCSKEFRYAMDKMDVNSQIIPVVLDEHMTDLDNWDGHLKFHLGPLLFIDMSTPDKIEKNLPNLFARIHECFPVNTAEMESIIFNDKNARGATGAM